MTPARLFFAAAILLLLGAGAMPPAIAAYVIADSSRELHAIGMGVWSSFVFFVAIGGPILLTLAGIIKLFLGGDD